MGKFKSTWRGSIQGRPPFEAGDRVTPNGNYKYRGWGHSEFRDIESVDYDEEFDRWTIRIKNHLSPLGYSNYSPNNFQQSWYDREQRKTPKMAQERSKYIGIRIDAEGIPRVELGFTPWMDTRHQAQVFVGQMIDTGQRWIVMQTVQMMEGEEPRPPIKITEYAR